MKAPALKLWLMVTLVLTLTQPEAIAFANLDEPYSVYKDLSIWMGCAGGGLTIVFVYGLYLWRRGKLALLHPMAVFLLAVGAFWLGYWTKGLGGTGYGVGGIANFIIGGFTVLFITPLLLLTGLPYVLRGELKPEFYHSYDRPLVIAWLIIVTIAVALTVLYLRTRRMKAHGT